MVALLTFATLLTITFRCALSTGLAIALRSTVAFGCTSALGIAGLLLTLFALATGLLLTGLAVFLVLRVLLSLGIGLTTLTATTATGVAATVVLGHILARLL